jgi:lipopolysaccharide exporter
MSKPSDSISILAGLRSSAGWFILSNTLKLGVGVWATRQLDPGDYSLLATVLAIQGFAIGLTAFNMSSELVRAARIESDDLSVAWTCEAIRNLAIWSVLLLLAPYAAGWLNRPDATLPLRVSITVLLVSLLISPRLVELRREGKFGTLGMIDGLTSLGNVLATVSLVMIFKNYWALIAAGILTPVFQALLSHILLPWRPRLMFDIARSKPMAKLGIVLLGITWIAAFREHGMVFLLSKSLSQTDLGFYNRALTFSYSLAFVACSLFWRVAYPIYARHSHEGLSPLKDASRTQIWILLLTFPFLTIAVLWKDYWIGLAFGSQWLPMAEIWSWLLVASALLLANAPFESAFQACRRERMGMLINALSATIQLLIAWLLLPILELSGAGVGMLSGITFSIICFRIAARKPNGATKTPEPPIPADDALP